jgi:hypothetical protein
LKLVIDMRGDIVRRGGGGLARAVFGVLTLTTYWRNLATQQIANTESSFWSPDFKAGVSPGYSSRRENLTVGQVWEQSIVPPNFFALGICGLSGWGTSRLSSNNKAIQPPRGHASVLLHGCLAHSSSCPPSRRESILTGMTAAITTAISSFAGK